MSRVGIMSVSKETDTIASLFPIMYYNNDNYLFEGYCYSFYYTGVLEDDITPEMEVKVYNLSTPTALPLETIKGTKLKIKDIELNGRYIYKLVSNPFRLVLVGVPTEKRSLLWS